MGDKAEGMVSGNGGGEEWGQGSDARTQMIAERWRGRSQRENVGSGSGGEGSGWGCGPEPNECKRGIDKQGSCSGSGPDDGKSGMPGDNGGEWTGEEPGHGLRSTRTPRVVRRVLHRTIGERTKLRRWRMMTCG